MSSSLLFLLFVCLFCFLCIYILAKHWHKRHWNSLSSKLIKMFCLLSRTCEPPHKKIVAFLLSFSLLFIGCLCSLFLLVVCLVKNADKYCNVVCCWFGFGSLKFLPGSVVCRFWISCLYFSCIQNIVVIRWKCIPAAAVGVFL